MSDISVDFWEELEALRESSEVECKKASKALPKAFWETYSSFANSYGGIVYFGLTEELDGSFIVTGVDNTDFLLQQLWDSLNNPEKANVNILTPDDVEVIDIDNKKIIKLKIPRANRRQKPVYINNNPKLGTYIRQHGGDYRATEEILQRMWSERGHEARDAQAIPGFDLADIDIGTLKTYRQMFQNRQPEHQFNALEDIEFLRALGAWKRERTSGQESITVAGLLMFGKYQSIREQFSNYHLDYLERSAAEKDSRYIDRVTLDGTWSGNLFEFYLKIIKKLTIDLKVRFQLEGDQRKEENKIHESLREALVNTLAHADYSGRASILIVKRPDMFGFRNPGLMRIPVEQAIEGGESDCRNSFVHDMFRMVGLSEKLGSGIRKIFDNWREEDWKSPRLHEKNEPEQTLLELHMIDLVSERIKGDLYNRFGDRFKELSELEKIVLVSAASEGWVNHERVALLTTTHSRNITIALPRLEKNGFLESKGTQKEKFYHLPGVTVVTPDAIFSDLDHGPNASNVAFNSSILSSFMSSDTNAPSSDINAPSSDTSAPSSDTNGSDTSSLNFDTGDNKNNGSTRDMYGRLVSISLRLPIIDNVNKLNDEYCSQLYQLADEARNKSRMARPAMQELIIKICSEHFITLNALALILNRRPDAVRQQYLSSMVKGELLFLAFPQTPTHEKQAYTSRPE
ncbi:putative transcriptional regulator [Yersinia intermedia]|uniref:RNA-binding domain-containing protein n=1 Tax=Yersinia TaxID=629 RepID=UPI0005ACBCFB|nr:MULTISPECIES: RNA-binding domain-containing protein [Yersinia]AJJ63827.1 divergent AAA domain protein [Yersinia aldovae 670-83]CQD74348.1 putative transcriptional regulator [Yersinia intermedia]